MRQNAMVSYPLGSNASVRLLPRLPVYPDKQTFPALVGMSQKCQFRKSFDLFPRGITAPLRKSCRSVVDAKPRGKMLEPILQGYQETLRRTATRGATTEPRATDRPTGRLSSADQPALPPPAR